MRRYIGRMTAALALVWTAAAQQPAQLNVGASSNGTQEIQRLKLEIAVLRLEFLHFQENYLTRIIASLQAELQWAQSRRVKVEESERRLQNQLAVLSRHLQDPSISDVDRRELKELEASRDFQPGSELAQLLTEKDSLLRREAELAQQIQLERSRLDTARSSNEALQTELARTLAAFQKPVR